MRNSLRKGNEFQRVLQEGKSYADGSLVLYVAPAPAQEVRVGFGVGRRIGNAVRRNRTKRLMREAFRRLAGSVHSDVHLVFLARRPASNATLDNLIRHASGLLERAGLLWPTEDGSREGGSP